MKDLIKLILLSLFLVSLHSCKKKEQEKKISENYSIYINSYPKTNISVVPDDLKFYLNKKIDPIINTEGIVSISPKIKGITTLFENAVLFTPTNALEANKEYKITLHLDKLYDNVPSKLQKLSVDLKTKELFYTCLLYTSDAADD